MMGTTFMDHDVQKIDAWLEATGTKEYRLGMMACANPKAVERIKSGSATVDTLRQVLQYIQENPS